MISKTFLTFIGSKSSRRVLSATSASTAVIVVVVAIVVVIVAVVVTVVTVVIVVVVVTIDSRLAFLPTFRNEKIKKRYLKVQDIEKECVCAMSVPVWLYV